MLKQTLVINILLLWQFASCKNLLDEIYAEPEFSEFAGAIRNSSELLKLSIKERSYTAFIPTNYAMQEHKKSNGEAIGESFVRYHLVNRPHKVQDLPEELGTDLEGTPSLYVTKKPSGKRSLTGWEENDYFINNAKVISANLMSKGSKNKPQYLHTIDRVLAPTVPRVYDESLQFINPDALMVLLNPTVYGFTEQFAIRELGKRMQELQANDSFAMEGKNTFFLPVDDAFKKFIRNDKDSYTKPIVHGHVIPEKVLFTRTTTDRTVQYETLAMTDSLKVYLSMQNVVDSDKNQTVYYVSSNILEGGPQHVKGTAMARIVKGNIPVKNGVVHLIDRPLMVVATSIMSYLQEGTGQISKFNQLLVDHYPDLINLLVSSRDLTLFAPSNTAFDLVNEERLKKVIANREKLTKMLKLHVIPRRLMTDEIVERSLREVFQEETMSDKRRLYFAVNDATAIMPVVSLEGAGVNATITTPNIVAKNGLIHVIDRILGIPSQSVFEKLQSDPMLRSTFELSGQRGWNEQLADKTKKFTLFVPSNSAWEYIKREMPSSHKKLFMGDYPTHASNILERHMIVNEDLSLDELSGLTKNSSEAVRDDLRQTRLQMTRGKIYFQAKVRKNFGGTEEEYFLEWNGMTARVVRPDVECVNGVVHVIDKVLMSRNDVTVNAAPAHHGGVFGFCLALISALGAWSLI